MLVTPSPFQSPASRTPSGIEYCGVASAIPCPAVLTSKMVMLTGLDTTSLAFSCVHFDAAAGRISARRG